MTTAADIITDDLLAQLNDPEPQRIWTNDILFKYITEAQNACILIGADANVVTSEFTLAQDSRQIIPADGVRFVDVEGNADGGSVTKISKKTMDDVWPDWSRETTDTAIEHFLFDDEQPSAFWVYPKPGVESLKIRLSYAAAVPLVTEKQTELVLSNLYLAPIKEYVLWRCLSMEGLGMASSLVVQHLQNFYTLQDKKYQGVAMLKEVQRE